MEVPNDKMKAPSNTWSLPLTSFGRIRVAQKRVSKRSEAGGGGGCTLWVYVAPKLGTTRLRVLCEGSAPNGPETRLQLHWTTTRMETYFCLVFVGGRKAVDSRARYGLRCGETRIIRCFTAGGGRYSRQSNSEMGSRCPQEGDRYQAAS